MLHRVGIKLVLGRPEADMHTRNLKEGSTHVWAAINGSTMQVPITARYFSTGRVTLHVNYLK